MSNICSIIARTNFATKEGAGKFAESIGTDEIEEKTVSDCFEKPWNFPIPDCLEYLKKASPFGLVSATIYVEEIGMALYGKYIFDGKKLLLRYLEFDDPAWTDNGSESLFENLEKALEERGQTMTAVAGEGEELLKAG